MSEYLPLVGRTVCWDGFCVGLFVFEVEDACEACGVCCGVGDCVWFWRDVPCEPEELATSRMTTSPDLPAWLSDCGGLIKLLILVTCELCWCCCCCCCCGCGCGCWGVGRCAWDGWAAEGCFSCDGCGVREADGEEEGTAR